VNILQKLSKAHITKDKVKYEEDKETIWNDEYNCDCMKAGGYRYIYVYKRQIKMAKYEEGNDTRWNDEYIYDCMKAGGYRYKM